MTDKKYKKEIATNGLQSLRSTFGWSQLDVAGKIGVSAQSIDRWEKGTGMPSFPNLLAIAALYKTLP